MNMTMPSGMKPGFSQSVKNTFMNSQATNPLEGMPHGKSLKHGREGVQVQRKNPFQGAIDKSALATRRY